MRRSLLGLPLVISCLTFLGCGQTESRGSKVDIKPMNAELPFSEDFNQGISAWIKEQDGLQVEETKGELHIFGTTAQGAWTRSGVKTVDIFPDTDFSASVDFRVPKFTGKGIPLIYLFAHSSGGQVGVFYSSRFGQGYRVQALNPSKSSDWSPACGDERNVNHRLRLDYNYKSKRASAYVDDDFIGSVESPMAGRVGFELCASTNRPGMNVDAYFDNFAVVSPPPTIAPSLVKKKRSGPKKYPFTDEEAKEIQNVREPEAAAMNLMLAVAKRDRKAIEKIIIPNPDSALLYINGKASSKIIKKLESHIEKGPSLLRRMKTGDFIFVSDKDSYIVETSDITADQVPLQEIDAPFATFIAKRIGGVWKIDVSFLIHSIKAATGKQ